jgi:uncharacterized phage-associated protein
MAAVLKTAMGLPPSRVRIPCPPQPLQDQQRRLTGSVGGPSYDAGMADDVYEAADVAVELRRRLPGVGVKKLHKRLYDCQGHHLADVGRPLFAESIAAWDMGPVVGKLWKSEQVNPPAASVRTLDHAALNTIGYVVSRYGALTGRDLEILSHGEQPWARARQHGQSAAIDPRKYLVGT